MSQKREITISPTTRIEGHGKVIILLDEIGNVSDAHFYATEIRGFDYFLRGMEAERLPFIISRICGVCSTAHIIASVKAIESIYRTEITETARKLRELLLMGQIISNHSLVFFFLTLPDFWFTAEEDPSKRNIFQIMQEQPDIGKKAIALRSFGARILRVIGKREVHIVSTIPGGLISPLKEREREKLLKEAKNACAITREAFTLGKELFDKNWEEFRKAGDYKTHYMSLTKDEALEFHNGKIRIINPEGKTLSEFIAQDFMKYLEEKTYEWTYAKFAYLKGLGWPKGIVQVGPTARMNVNSRANTEHANRELREFRRKFGSPAHATLLFDYARLIDLMYACERAKELLADERLTRTDTRVEVKPRRGRGIGVVEAPRGTLAHEYTLTRNGRLKSMKLIIPTQVNNAAINLNVKDAAMEFIQHGEIKPGLLNRIEMVIRAYDPCIKCATRLTNENLRVEIRNSKGELLRILEN
ncbi:MAG: Ni/Fe hydrogenase subunit alpha [Candidatus Bathyarchaeota archaeon]|nr:Ni/Fe hydrogenase subunit alpha [Candidatus Bathyarchaeota archaeon]MDH5779157.1 Ni/Fe hydrogenase subunit alpha [Candidatus Bathyarchaeota archaeon]